MSRTLTIPDDLAERARTLAEARGTSLDGLLLDMLAHGVGSLEGLAAMEERAARADVPGALALLEKAPDVPPDEFDEIPAFLRKR